MKFLIFFLFILALPSVIAIDCNDLANKEWCHDIKDSNISEEEKNYLLSDVISDKKHYPDHGLVKEWNSKISISTFPEGITGKNKGYIKNSWVKILAVMPSVLFNDILYISNKGEVLTAFDHDVQIPSTTASGDCKTKRYLLENKGWLNLYLGNQPQSSVDYSTSLPHNSKVNIIAKYTAKVKTKIKHYTLQEEYSWFYGKNRWVCKYDHTEYKTDKLVVKDTIKAKIHNPQLKASFKIKDKYLNTVKGEFISQGVVNAELSFFDSYYREHNYVFSEISGPLNILTVKAEKQPNKEDHNLARSDGKIVVTKTDGCKIRVDDFFKSELISCDLNYESPEFIVSTDKKVYAEDETIKLKIEPVGKEYQVVYAGEEYITNGELELKAKYAQNKITVQNKEKIVSKLIHVKNDQPLNVAFSLFLFGTVNYTLVGLLRKYWGGLID